MGEKRARIVDIKYDKDMKEIYPAVAQALMSLPSVGVVASKHRSQRSMDLSR